MSMSYMGNKSEQMEEYIFNNFLGHIVFFIIKILLVYLIIGLIIGIVAHVFLLSYSYLFQKKISRMKGLVFTLLFSLTFFVLSFLRDIILYPQVYMDNFYIKNSTNKFILDFFAGNFSPHFFSFLQFFLIAVIVLFVFLAVRKAMGRKTYIFLSVISGIVLAVLFFSAFELGSTIKSEKPNVLILASDAIRPDHLRGYGYFRKTTPNIDRLIDEGISFKNAFIEVPRTFPSWVSILTGQFSATHGIRHMFPTARDINRDFKSIAKIFKEEGYSTSVVADYAGDIFSRIELGFENVDTPYFNSEYFINQIILGEHTFLFPFLTNKTGLSLFPVLKDSASFCPPSFVKDGIINAIEKSGGRPFFITTFFSSTHFPYASPYPYYKLYTKRDYDGPYKYHKHRMISLDKNEEVRISDEDIEQIRSLYDGGLKALDDEIGKIINYLEDNDLLDNTIILVLSDHGENLYEGDLGMGHGEHFRGLYSYKIPFVIRFPELGLQRREIYDVVRHVDVAPTILSVLKKPVPEFMEGVSLLPLTRGEKTKKLFAFGETGIWFDNNMRDDLFFQKLRIIYPDFATLAEVDFQLDKQAVLNDNYRDIVNFAKHRYVYDGRYKLIYMPLMDRVIYEMYDVKNDPDEKKNIASIDKANFRRLKNILFKWIMRNNDVTVKRDYIYPVLRY